MSACCAGRWKAFEDWKRESDDVLVLLMKYSTQCEAGTAEDRILLLDDVRQRVGAALICLQRVTEACAPGKRIRIK